jgi:hypothetical protein
LSRESRTNPLTREVMWVHPTRQCFLRLCHRTHLYSTIWHSTDGKTHRNGTRFEACCILGFYRAWSGYSIQCLRITNLSHFQVSRCPRRTCLDSRQPARAWCLLEEQTVTEFI